MTLRQSIPNLLTCGNVITGTLGIVNVFSGNLQATIYYVLIAGVFDFLDGFAARTLKVHSAMGKELDSLADMVSFSVLPALFLYQYLLVGGFEVSPYIALLIAPFSAWRLAKFNIDDRQSDKFIGLPTPANAILITAFGLAPHFEITEVGWLAIALGSCFLLVSSLELIALKFKDTRFSENWMRYLVIVISIAILLIWRTDGLVFVIPVYILISLIANFAGRKSVL